MKKYKKECSAGGLVVQKKDSQPIKILMVEVCNLEKKTVWTFPKGHLEKNETPYQAAIREVQEETGWKCRKPSRFKQVFQKIYYEFKRGEELIKKEVIWFLMEPIEKKGKPDPDEILESKWFTIPQAKKHIQYPSDQQLIHRLTESSWFKNFGSF